MQRQTFPAIRVKTPNQLTLMLVQQRMCYLSILTAKESALENLVEHPVLSRSIHLLKDDHDGVGLHEPTSPRPGEVQVAVSYDSLPHPDTEEQTLQP